MSLNSEPMKGVRIATTLLILCALWPGIALANLYAVSSFRIPPEPVPAALVKFTLQSGVQVTSAAAIVRGKKSPGVIGRFPNRSALDKLLAGTGLHYQVIDPHTVAIKDGGLVPAKYNAHDPYDPKATTVHPAPAATQGFALAPIVVTAERYRQSENLVPMTITALSGSALDQLGIQNVDQLVKHTPGVTLGYSNILAQPAISIRGISSPIGSQTTGIYINDTPIQVRNAGYTSTNFYPVIFDLARTEVLFGPQGTLFGAGSEGGAIRFITNKPSFTTYSAYARSGISFTRNGSENYQDGVAAGGPIVRGRLAFRASAYIVHSGGYIDRVNPQTMLTENADANYSRTDSENVSLAYKPTSRLTVTASIFHQGTSTPNFDQTFWMSLSDPSEGRFVNGNLLPSPDNDQFFLPSVKVVYRFSGYQVISDTSYVYRHDVAHPDYSEFVDFLTDGSPYPPSATDYARANFLDTQRFVTEELRIQSNPDSRLKWVGGLFFHHNRQIDEEQVPYPNFAQFWLQTTGIPYLDIFGTPLGPDSSVYEDIERIRDNQYAAFGQVAYDVWKGLTATAGIRFSRYIFDFTSTDFGPWAGRSVGGGETTESAVTPKFSVSYRLNKRDMVYATVAKGFRPGGAQRVPPSICGTDLASLGIKKPSATYNSDYVWSYEVGSKDAFANDRVYLSGSLFYIKWYNMENEIFLPTCGQSTILNIGSATSKGADFSVRAEVLPGLLANLGVGYTHAVQDQTVRAAGASYPLLVKGDTIPGPQGYLYGPWQLNAGLQYDREVFTHDAFIRADYTYQGEGPKNDPLLLGYNPLLPRTPAVSLVSLRLGVTVHRWQISLFCNNLLNSHVVVQQYQMENFSPLYYGFTVRPRTVGIRAIFRMD